MASLRCWGDAVTPQDIAHRLIRNNMSQIGQCSDDPVIAPAGILTSHADDELTHLTPESRPPRIGTVAGTVKLLSDESAIPGKNGVGLSHPRNSPQRFAAEPFSDLRQGRPLRIGKPQSNWQMGSQDLILRSQILVLEQQFLIHQSCYIGQQPCPVVVFHADCPSSQIVHSHAGGIF